MASQVVRLSLLSAAITRRTCGAEHVSGEAEGLRCSVLEDPNGRWEGSTVIGGKYTLTCAPGFMVNGRHNQTATIECQQKAHWPELLTCENVDDCDKLKDGCGAYGICMDLINGYDCNCEEGQQRRYSKNGEITCGSKWDSFCGGHTCGAYGICIDLNGNNSQFEGSPMVKSFSKRNTSLVGNAGANYRCECTDGFFDNGVTCEPVDCGDMDDVLGHWSGSSRFGSDFTLTCPPGSFVYGGYFQKVTLSCPPTGMWLEHPYCVSPSLDKLKAQFTTLWFWKNLLCALMCVACAALAAGLTLGLVSIEPFGLLVTLTLRHEDCTSEQERENLQHDQENSKKLRPVVLDHHKLLVTLLLFNTLANEALPVFLDQMVPSWAAVLLSVTVVLICGEVLPSAIFTGPNQLAIATAFVPVVKILQYVFYPVARPIALMLDHFIGEDGANENIKYSRAELLALLDLHGRQRPNHEDDHCISRHDGYQAFEKKDEDEEDEEKHHDTKTPLSEGELQLILCVLGLDKSPIKTFPFTRLQDCMLIEATERCCDALLNRPMNPNARVALVMREGSIDAVDVACPMISRRHIVGCLPLRSIVTAGETLAGNLCTEPPVLLLHGGLSALEALHTLAKHGQAQGVVMDGLMDQGVVQGIVTSAQLLGDAELRQPSIAGSLSRTSGTWHRTRANSALDSRESSCLPSPCASSDSIEVIEGMDRWRDFQRHRKIRSISDKNKKRRSSIESVSSFSE